MEMAPLTTSSTSPYPHPLRRHNINISLNIDVFLGQSLIGKVWACLQYGSRLPSVAPTLATLAGRTCDFGYRLTTSIH